MHQTMLPAGSLKLLLCLQRTYACLLMLFPLMATSAVCYGSLQDSALLTMRLHQAPLQKAFAIIKQQTAYRVIYDNSLLQKAKPVSLIVNKEPLLKVLPLLFQSQPFSYRLMDQSIIVTPRATTTVKTMPDAKQTEAPLADTIITGRVLADSGRLPLQGATIQVKGSGMVAQTDSEGSFRIQLPKAGGSISISYVGHLSETVTINSRTTFPLTVLLAKKPTEMDAVTLVSTGYESLPKERVTGSFTQIDHRTLNQQVGPNIIDRLKGVASSVLFDSKNDGPAFTVRGLSTINGPKEPLIILDNYPYEGNINNINPNDVETITILKDAAAASIWGTRAGNGVVVITTKKGRFNQPLKLEFNSNTIITEKPNLFYLPQISSADYVDVEEMLFDKGFFNNQVSSSPHLTLSPAVEILLLKRQGIISPQEAAAELGALKVADIRHQYNRHFYQPAVHQQHALNIRGGSDKISYLVSGGYDKGLSNLGAPNRRITLRTDNSYKPTNALQLNVGLIYTSSLAKSGRPEYGDILIGTRQVPYLSFADASGKPVAIAKRYRHAYTDTAGGGKLLDWKYYPLEDYQYQTSETNLSDLVGKLGLNYRIMPGLDIDIKYQYQKQQTSTLSLAGLQSYYTRDLINKYTQIDYATGKLRYGIPMGGVFGKSVAAIETQNIRGQLNFNKKWGRHEWVSLLGSELRQTTAETDNLSAFGYDPQILTTGVVDPANPYLNFVTGSYDYLNGGGVSFSAKNNRFVSFFGNASYIFKQRYILTGSIRKDASNLFGKATNDKWTPLWSVGAGWNISTESFYKSGLLPDLKLRATYGYSGNVDQSKSAVTVMAYGGNASYTNFPSGGITQFKNSELRWERVNMLNVGLDFSFRNKVLSGSVEYYRKKGIDLFGPAPIDYTAGLGYFTTVKNVADMKAAGLDLNLQSQVVERKNIQWAINFLLSYNLAKTDKYYLEKGRTTGSFVNFGNSITPIPGQPLYSLISYQSSGLNAQGYPQGFLNKQVSTNYAAMSADTIFSNLAYHGTAVPAYFGSLTNHITWKRMTVGVNFSYKLGYAFRRSYLSYDQLFNNGIGHKEYAERWKQPGDELKTGVPSLIYPVDRRRDQFYGLSEATVEKGDHIRLQYISLSYDLIKNASQKSVFKDVVLYSNVSNLGIIWRANKKGIDPDAARGLPLSKMYSIGIRTNY